MNSIILSVLMPVGRIDKYLSVSINSLREQTYKEFYCYILTPKLSKEDLITLTEFIGGDSRFKIQELSLGGISFALNFGINLCNTKYVARMDGDDICHPMRFERQVEFLENNADYGVVGCKVLLIGENGEVLPQRFKFYEADEEIRRALKFRMPMCHPCLTFRRSVLLENKGYLYGNTAEDHELFLRIARDASIRFKNIDETLFYYRRHHNQLTDIRFAKKAYCDIAGFMFTEFLRSKKFVYLFGAAVNHPSLRKLRALIREIRGNLN